jgi:hypothetical protein
VRVLVFAIGYRHPPFSLFWHCDASRDGGDSFPPMENVGIELQRQAQPVETL